MNGFSGATCESNRIDSTSWTPTHATSSAAPRTFFTLNWWNKVAVVLIVWISCGLMAVGSAAPQDVPSGTIEFSGGSVAAGVGYTWGKGILIFEGKAYKLKVDGLSIVQVGISHYTATGTVYNLTSPSDIAGVYTAAAAGVAVAGGASATAMKNSKGVLIQMTSTHVGVNFSLSVKGVTISLYGKSFPAHAG
jgi:hypothetical protein